MNPWAIVAGIAFLLANGWFVLVEFALVGSRQTKLEPAAAAGDRRSARALGAVRDLNTRLAGAQLGITAASLGLGAVAEPALAEGLAELLGGTGLARAVAHTIAVVVAITVVVFLHMVVGEMVPKSIALVDPERALRAVAGVDRAYVAVARPVLWVLTSLANLGVRLTGVEPRDELSQARTAEELAVMVAASRDEGVIDAFAADLMTGVLDFGGQPASAVMVPRNEIAAVPNRATVAEVERAVVASGHTRLLVVGSDRDDVRGFVHAKDLLTLDPAAADRPLPPRLVRRLLVVPPERSAEALLLAMRRARVHLAVVVDQLGRTLGLVTIEDLLEELVGDILDESDRVRGRDRPE